MNVRLGYFSMETFNTIITSDVDRFVTSSWSSRRYRL